MQFKILWNLLFWKLEYIAANTAILLISKLFLLKNIARITMKKAHLKWDGKKSHLVRNVVKPHKIISINTKSYFFKNLIL